MDNNMFIWKDYGENSNCFIGDIKHSVASINYKHSRVEDFTTGKRFKLKSEKLNEQKKEAEQILLKYWNDIIKEFSGYLK